MKYGFTGKIKEIGGHTVHQIYAAEARDGMEEGFVGGWIENASNLSQAGSCFVYDDAVVHGNAVVEGDAMVRDRATVCDNARIRESADISGFAVIEKEAQVYGLARAMDHAVISGSAHLYDSAAVIESAVVTDKARVYGHARIAGDAEVFDGAQVYDNAQVTDGAMVGYNAEVCGDARVAEDMYIGKDAYLNTTDTCMYREGRNEQTDLSLQLTGYRTKENGMLFHTVTPLAEGSKGDILKVFGNDEDSRQRAMKLIGEMEDGLGENFTPLEADDLEGLENKGQEL